MILTARYVAPVDVPVMENGAVRVRDHVIVDVGPRRRVLHQAGEKIFDYGDAVLCPGFVNAHTHLELGHLAGKVPPGSDFIDWLGRLTDVLLRDPMDRADVERATGEGVRQSLAHGVTTLGDIARHPTWTRRELARHPIRAVSYGEIIAMGRTRHLLPRRLQAALDSEGCSLPRAAGLSPRGRSNSDGRHDPDSAIGRPPHEGTPDDLPARTARRLTIGLSPHAPYTVEPEAMRQCALAARHRALPLCIHLLETRDEDLFTRKGKGPLADHLRRTGVWDDDVPTARCSPVELTRQTGLLTERTLLAHANYAAPADIHLIARAGASVAYCPRTHAAFRHDPHPFVNMLAAGVNVCIGTDSLASNPSLSILDELRFLCRMGRDVRDQELSPDELLAMGTIRGARALGLERWVGSIMPGKDADIVALSLPSDGADKSWHRIFDEPAEPLAVLAGGSFVTS